MALGCPSQWRAALRCQRSVRLIEDGVSLKQRRQRVTKWQRIRCSNQKSDTLSLPWAGPDRGYGSIATQRTQYVVDFHKAPFTGLGLTFASDPETGEFTVNDIIEDSPASYSQIQVGDRLRMVSSAFDGGAATLQSQASKAARQQERVSFLFERPSIWELQMRSVPCAGARVGTTSVTDRVLHAGRPLRIMFSPPGKLAQGKAGQRVTRPKSHREQAALMCSLIEQACELPPVPLTPASERRWALEFEGHTLMTFRRMPNSRWHLVGTPLLTSPVSNIVPFPAFYDSGAGLQRVADSAAQPQGRGPPTHAIFALPWLIMASGQLGTRDVETVASACGLSRLLDLDLDSSRLHLEERRLAGASDSMSTATREHQNEALALVRSAAALQRLVIRRGGSGMDYESAEDCCILVHTAHDAAETNLSTLLAAWLTWFGRLDPEEAVQAAQKALGYEPDASAIAAASKLLLDGCCEARRQVRLTWPYGGGNVEVAGDVVGGWHVRTPLQLCAGQQGSTTTITGLEPGTYRYKFIVDGMWVVDMALPAECDAEGNTNNVVHVPDCCAASLTPAQALSNVRLQAARTALTTKLGVGCRRS